MATTFSRVFNSYLKPIQPQEVHDKKLFDEVMQVMPKVHHVLRIAAEMEQEVRQESIPS